MSAEVRITSPDDRRTTPGRAIAERFRVEYAVEALVDEAVNEYLLITHQMAQTMLVSDTVLTAAGEEAVAPFTPSQMTLVWDLAVEHAMRGGFSNVLSILPPRLQAIVRGLYSTGKALDFMDDVFSDYLYQATLGLFGQAHEQGLHIRRVEKMLDQVFARALPDGRPSGIQTRAQRMARSAATSTYNRAMLEQLRADGYALKLWVSHHDERVRDSHLHADGVAIPLDDPFRVGDGLLAYPGDPHAPIGETINCRCVIVGENGDPTPGIDWDQPVISLSERQRLGYEPGYVVPDEEMPLAASGSYNPDQARAPKGTPIGGQWIYTPGGLLKRIPDQGPQGTLDLGIEDVGPYDVTGSENYFLPNRRSESFIYPVQSYLYDNVATRSLITDEVREFMSEKASEGVTISMFEKGMRGLIREGRLRNAHELADGTRGEFYMNTRNEYEVNSMGTRDSLGANGLTNPIDRPIYGHAGWDPEAANANGYYYGSFQVKLSPRVLDRTSWTLGDSMDKELRPLWTREIAEGSDEAIFATAEDVLREFGNHTDPDGSFDYDFAQWRESIPYVEAQVFGGVTLEDVAEISIPSGYIHSFETEDLQRLVDRGIAVTIDGEGDWDPSVMEFSARTETFAWNPKQARAPKGTSIGGQWIDTPSALLDLFERVSERGYTAGHGFNETYPWLKFEDSYGLERDQGVALKMEAQRFVGDMTLDRFNDRVNDYLREGGLPSEDTYDRKVRDYLLKKDDLAPTFLPGEASEAYWNQGTLGEGDEVTAGIVRAIDTAATYNTLNAPVRLFRGVSVDDTRDFEVGMQIRELGYSSTTYENYVAHEFANFRSGLPSALDEGTDILRDDEREGIPMVMTMVIAPGTHYVYGVKGIGEVILERDMVYEVVEKNLGGITVMGYPARMVNEELAEVAA